jgi:hypothetical protein
MSHPDTDSVGNGIGDRRGGRPLRCLAGAEKRLARPIEHVDLDRITRLREAHDRITAPVAAENAASVKQDALIKRPARGLHDAALDLVLVASGLIASSAPA